MSPSASTATHVGASRPLTTTLGPAEWALLALHSILWGSAFFFVDVAKSELPALTINALRLIPATAILLAVIAVRRLSLTPLHPHWRRVLLLAIFNNALPFILIIYAQGTGVSGGLAAVFIATTPMFSALMAHWITGDERLTGNRIAGLALGVAGVAILTGAADVGGDWLAKIALTAAAASYALAGMFTRRLRHIPPHVLATGQMATSLMLSMPLALAIDQPWLLPMPSVAAVAAVCGSGIFGSAIAALCYFTLIARVGATNALLVTLLIPLTPMTLGAIVLSQSLRLNEIAGAAVIAAALLLVDGRIVTWVRLRLAGQRQQHVKAGVSTVEPS